MNTNIEDYVRTKQDQIKNWEQTAEKRAHDATDKVSERMASFRAKRDEIVKKLDALRHETTDRVDVLKMGVESAWAELKTAFETATSAHPNETKH